MESNLLEITVPSGKTVAYTFDYCNEFGMPCVENLMVSLPEMDEFILADDCLFLTDVDIAFITGKIIEANNEAHDYREMVSKLWDNR